MKRFIAVLACLSATVVCANEAAAPPAAKKPDTAKAQTIVTQVCAACHGADGNSVSAANPNIAGQHAKYITTQLGHFKSGERKNAVMSGMVATLTPEDMESLGAYFAEKKPKANSAKDLALAKLGEKIYRGGNAATGLPACAGCHAPNGIGIPAQYPRLSGQYTDYTIAQLKAFNTGERSDVMMNGIAARLSEKEIKAVAEYIAGLH
ncbi:MAG: c-type cytochrome [Burkholderiales bacterium]